MQDSIVEVIRNSKILFPKCLIKADGKKNFRDSRVLYFRYIGYRWEIPTSRKNGGTTNPLRLYWIMIIIKRLIRSLLPWANLIQLPPTIFTQFKSLYLPYEIKFTLKKKKNDSRPLSAKFLPANRVVYRPSG